MLINVDSEIVVNILIDRLKKFWNNDKDVVALYEKMYKNYAEEVDIWSGEEFDPQKIVDNDYVNYCDVISKEDCTEEEWELYCKAIKEYQNDISVEIRDIENKNYCPSFIEAYDNYDNPKYILIRN